METDVAARVTLARVAEEAGVSLVHDLEGAQRPAGCLGRRPARASRQLLARARLPAPRAAGRESQPSSSSSSSTSSTAIWSMEIIARRRGRSPSRHGLSVVLTESGSRHAPGPDWIEGVLRRRPVGVVLVFSDLAPEYRERLRSRAIPFVIVDPAGDPSPDVPSVGSANWSGGLMATRHLIELGHRRIAAITGPDDMMCSLARVDGYRSAMNSAGLPIDPDWIRFGDFHVDGRPRARPRAARPARPPDRDLRRQRPAGARRARGGARARPARSRGPLDRRLRRHPARPLGEPAAHDRAPAAAPDGGGGGAPRDPPGRRAPLETTPRMDLATSLVVRESTAPPPAGVGEAPGRRPSSCRVRAARRRRRSRMPAGSTLDRDHGVQPRGCGRRRASRPSSAHRVRERRCRRSTGRRRARARRARRCARRRAPVNDARSAGTSNAPSRARPAPSVDARVRRSAAAPGRTTDATGSCRYSCTTSVPARSPALRDGIDTVTAPSTAELGRADDAASDHSNCV